MFKKALKIGCVALVVGTMAFPAWGGNFGKNLHRSTVLAGRGHGPGNGTGNGGHGPKDGSGHGSKAGDCVFMKKKIGHFDLFARGGHGNRGGSKGNAGSGPKDGTGPRSQDGTCINL